jgi:hypothetical protein
MNNLCQSRPATLNLASGFWSNPDISGFEFCSRIHRSLPELTLSPIQAVIYEFGHRLLRKGPSKAKINLSLCPWFLLFILKEGCDTLSRMRRGAGVPEKYLCSSNLLHTGPDTDSLGLFFFEDKTSLCALPPKWGRRGITLHKDNTTCTSTVIINET